MQNVLGDSITISKKETKHNIQHINNESRINNKLFFIQGIGSFIVQVKTEKIELNIKPKAEKSFEGTLEKIFNLFSRFMYASYIFSVLNSFKPILLNYLAILNMVFHILPIVLDTC